MTLIELIVLLETTTKKPCYTYPDIFTIEFLVYENCPKVPYGTRNLVAANVFTLVYNLTGLTLSEISSPRQKSPCLSFRQTAAYLKEKLSDPT